MGWSLHFLCLSLSRAVLQLEGLDCPSAACEPWQRKPFCYKKLQSAFPTRGGAKFSRTALLQLLQLKIYSCHIKKCAINLCNGSTKAAPLNIGSCFWKHVSPNECNLIHRWTSAFWHSLTWVFYDFTGATHICKIENETVSESIEGHLSTGMMPPWPCRRHAADKHWQRLPCTDRSGWSGCCPEFFQSFVMSTGMAVSYTNLWTSYIAATEYSCFRTALFNPRLLESWNSLTPTLVTTMLRSAHCLPLLGKRRNVILFRERQGKCFMVWTRVSLKLCIDESMYLCMYVTVCLHVNL